MGCDIAECGDNCMGSKRGCPEEELVARVVVVGIAVEGVGEKDE
jgi:hypothetical protein